MGVSVMSRPRAKQTTYLNILSQLDKMDEEDIETIAAILSNTDPVPATHASKDEKIKNFMFDLFGLLDLKTVSKSDSAFSQKLDEALLKQISEKEFDRFRKNFESKLAKLQAIADLIEADNKPAADVISLLIKSYVARYTTMMSSMWTERKDLKNWYDPKSKKREEYTDKKLIMQNVHSEANKIVELIQQNSFLEDLRSPVFGYESQLEFKLKNKFLSSSEKKDVNAKLQAIRNLSSILEQKVAPDVKLALFQASFASKIHVLEQKHETTTTKFVNSIIDILNEMRKKPIKHIKSEHRGKEFASKAKTLFWQAGMPIVEIQPEPTTKKKKK